MMAKLVHMCVCVCMYSVYVGKIGTYLCVYVCVCVYSAYDGKIGTYVCVCIYIYISIYILCV